MFASSMQPGSRSNKPLISEDIPITNWHESVADRKVFRAALPAAPCPTVLKQNKKPYEPPKERSSQLESPCHLSNERCPPAVVGPCVGIKGAAQPQVPLPPPGIPSRQQTPACSVQKPLQKIRSRWQIIFYSLRSLQPLQMITGSAVSF